MTDKAKILAGRRAVDAYCEAHRLLHSKPWHRGIPEEHTPLLVALNKRLQELGFDSLEDYEASREEYKSSADTVLRPERMVARLLYLPALPSSDFMQEELEEGLCDVELFASSPSHFVGVPEAANIDDVVNTDFCQAHKIPVWKSKYIRATSFRDRQSATIRVRQVSDLIEPKLMIRLLKLTIKDACVGLGLNPNSISITTRNDVLVNGKKITGMSVWEIEQDVYIIRSYCNLGLDKELMEGALKDKEGVAKATSISAELGKSVSEDAFSDLIIQSLSTRFNLEMVECQQKH